MATSGKRGAAARPSPRAQTHSPGSEDSRSLGSLPRNEAPRPAGISETTSPGSVKREAELVIADPEHVALADRPALHALAVVLDAVRRAHVHDVVAPVRELDHRVLAGHVRILDRQITGLPPATDDEALLGDRENL